MRAIRSASWKVRLSSPDAVLLVCTVLVALLYSCGRAVSKASSPPPPEVEVADVVRLDVPVVKEWVGMLRGSVDADIHARVSGNIIEQDYVEGSAVKKGARLFLIDPAPYEAALAQAKASLARAKAAQFKSAIDLRRNVTLLAKKIISQEDYDNTLQADQSAKADILAAEAAVQSAELNLEYTRVTAPVDGVVGTAITQVGNLVGPSTGELTSISTIDPIKATVGMSEQEYLALAPQLKAEQAEPIEKREARVEMILADGSTYPYKGKIEYSDRQVNERTGTMLISVLFPNPGGLLRPGQFARLRAATSIQKGGVVVPQRAVKELQGSAQVAVLGPDSTASFRTVTTGERFGSLWEITKGLSPGEKVVVEGLQKVREGTHVVVKPYKPTPAEAKALLELNEAGTTDAMGALEALDSVSSGTSTSLPMEQ